MIVSNIPFIPDLILNPRVKNLHLHTYSVIFLAFFIKSGNNELKVCKNVLKTILPILNAAGIPSPSANTGNTSSFKISVIVLNIPIMAFDTYTLKNTKPADTAAAVIAPTESLKKNNPTTNATANETNMIAPIVSAAGTANISFNAENTV